MAKQTFTTGQVLTAAQMTSLQQTAMGGGSTTDKTTSYVLVAADAGTTVIMNAAGATTITVNTALFAAGDTVNIQNIGAGICTVTAGTATVNTAGSLALNQYEGGVLYFRSTSAATFFDYVQSAGAVAPSYSLLGTGTTTSGSTVTVSGISGINSIYVLFKDVSTNSASQSFYSFRLNGDSTTKYQYYGNEVVYNSSYAPTYVGTQSLAAQTQVTFTSSFAAASVMAGGIAIEGCNSSGVKPFTVFGNTTLAAGTNIRYNNLIGTYDGTSTISSISLLCDAGSFDAGSFLVYGSA